MENKANSGGAEIEGVTKKSAPGFLLGLMFWRCAVKSPHLETPTNTGRKDYKRGVLLLTS